MDIARAVEALAASDDHRVLTRIPPVADWPLSPGAGGELRRALFVDVETTGLEEKDEVIELALLPFDYERDSGAVVRVRADEAYTSLRAPSFPIPPESTRVHGITQTDVEGHEADAAKIAALVGEAHLVIAHNAGFDRPMLEKHWPVFEHSNWACTLADIAWRDEGVSSGKLDYLLMRQGWFYDGHRALGDALAGVFLLTLPLPHSGARALKALLDRARRPLKAVRAEGAAFEARAALKQRGYRWDPGGQTRAKAWWKLTEDADAEIAWLNSEIYPAPRPIPVQTVSAKRRYSARLWDGKV